MFYAVAGAAVAAAANDEEHSGIISSVLVEYLRPAAIGDVLCAEIYRETSTDREDIFTGTIRRGDQGDLLAWVRARGTRRSRTGLNSPGTAAGPWSVLVMAESVGIVSLTPSAGRRTDGRVSAERATGRDRRLRRGAAARRGRTPSRSSPGAAGRPASLGRSGGYRVTARLDRRAAGARRAASACAPAPLPGPGERIDTLVLAGGSGVAGGRGTTHARSGGSRRPRPAAGGWPRSARARSSPPRPVSSAAGGSPPIGRGADAVSPPSSPARGRPRPHLHPRRQVWTSAGVTAGHRPVAGPRPGRPRARRGPDRGPLAGDVPAPPGRARPSSPRRSGCRGPSARPSGPCRRLVEAAPGGDHRLPALAAAAAMSVRHFTRVFTAEVGETPGTFVERVRAGGGPARARDHRRHARRDRGPLRLRHRRDPARVFQRRLGVAPDAYRRRFRTVTDERTSA